MARMSLAKMVAVNTWTANHNLMFQLEEQGEKYSVQYLLLKRENERLEKRYPSLR
jgi:hypothetical protein